MTKEEEYLHPYSPPPMCDMCNADGVECYPPDNKYRYTGLCKDCYEIFYLQNEELFTKRAENTMMEKINFTASLGNCPECNKPLAEGHSDECSFGECFKTSSFVTITNYCPRCVKVQEWIASREKNSLFTEHNLLQELKLILEGLKF